MPPTFERASECFIAMQAEKSDAARRRASALQPVKPVPGFASRTPPAIARGASYLQFLPPDDAEPVRARGKHA